MYSLISSSICLSGSSSSIFFVQAIIPATGYIEKDTHIPHVVFTLETMNHSVLYARFHFLFNSRRKFCRSSFSISIRLTFFSKSSGLFVGRPRFNGDIWRMFTSGLNPHHDCIVYLLAPYFTLNDFIDFSSLCSATIICLIRSR